MMVNKVVVVRVEMREKVFKDVNVLIVVFVDILEKYFVDVLNVFDDVIIILIKEMFGGNII